MDKLRIANALTYELTELNRKIRLARMELNKLLNEKERQEYLSTLIAKELTEKELEIFNRLKRPDDEF
jgi:DNA integrity scanning protein DisA with diadenylate cyclase activity